MADTHDHDHDPTAVNDAQPVHGDPAEEHRHAVEALEHAVFHETTQHAPKHHEQKVQATPPTPRSQQRRFPR